MDHNSIRVTALDFARNLYQVKDPYELIQAANLIEDYIRAGNTIPTTSGKIDFDAQLREKPSTNEYLWSGYAAELIKACNTGNVLIKKSRQSGLTRLMSEFFGHQTKQNGKSVLWLVTNKSNVKNVEDMLVQQEADMTFVKVMTYATLREGLRGCRGFDFVYADELAYLPFSDDNTFLATIMPLGRRFIFGSTPNQPKGVFFDLWQNSYSFYKFSLTWDMSLMEVTQERLERKEELGQTLGNETFRNNYMAEFRQEEEKLNINPASTPTYQYWNNANTTGTAPAPVFNSGGYVHWTTAAGNPQQGWTSLNTDTVGGNTVTAPTWNSTVATANGNLSFDPVDKSELDKMVQKVSPEPVKRTKKKPRTKGATFNDEDYTDPVG